MIHIVFQTADVEVLNKAIELDASLSGEIFEIKDDYAVGPLRDLDTEEGWKEREQWWAGLLQQSPYAKDQIAGSFDDRTTVQRVKEYLDQHPEDQAWIWMAQNQHDVTGYYWLLPQLKLYVGRISVLYLNNLPFINEKGQLFYPTVLHKIQPKEFLKAKKLNRPVTPSEFEVDPDEWKRLVEENALIRILEGGKKIVGADDNYFDKNILNGLTNEWQKGSRALHNILNKMKVFTGDVFLLARIRTLIEAGAVDMNGDPSKGWKEFELRLKSNQPAETAEATTEVAAQ